MSEKLKQYLKEEIPCYCTPPHYERGLVNPDCSSFTHTNGTEDDIEEVISDIKAIIEPELREQIAQVVEELPCWNVPLFDGTTSYPNVPGGIWLDREQVLQAIRGK